MKKIKLKNVLFFGTMFLTLLGTTQQLSASSSEILQLQQQIRKVSGTVTDPLSPIPGVTLVEMENPTNGTVSDMDGNFELDIPVGSTLVISAIGYKTQQVAISATDAPLNIVLEEDSQLLDDVVVTALGMVEIYRNYHYAFSQHLMGAWNTTNYGGRHTIDNNEMSRIWTSFYPNAIKNLTDGMVRTAEDPDKVNIHSALRIYRRYMTSLITDIYGDAPYSEAGMGYLDSKFNPRYDTQEDIYMDFFKELGEAVAAFDNSKDQITGDVIFDGNLGQWKKLANSLRLRFAMRI